MRRALNGEPDGAAMARIPPQDLNCAFYLYPSLDAAKAGEKAGGSGFWISVMSMEVKYLWWNYAVSNAHVVHRQGASVIRANSKDGGVCFIEAEPTDWIEHPNGHDVAVLLLNPNTIPQDIEALPVSQGMFVTQNDVRIELVGVGDEIYMIGRFVNHEGRVRNTPSARFGNISMLPGEPIYVDETTAPQESFAVELRSSCGYSGSPVFVRSEVGRNHRPSAMGPDALLGVHWGNIIEPWQVETKIVKTRQAALAPNEAEIDMVYANTGMNGVVPAWRLLELLNMPKVKGPRAKEENDEKERQKRTNPGAALQSSGGGGRPSIDANPNHQEDFSSLVSAAARRRARED